MNLKLLPCLWVICLLISIAQCMTDVNQPPRALLHQQTEPNDFDNYNSTWDNIPTPYCEYRNLTVYWDETPVKNHLVKLSTLRIAGSPEAPLPYQPQPDYPLLEAEVRIAQSQVMKVFDPLEPQNDWRAEPVAQRESLLLVRPVAGTLDGTLWVKVHNNDKRYNYKAAMIGPNRLPLNAYASGALPHDFNFTVPDPSEMKHQMMYSKDHDKNFTNGILLPLILKHKTIYIEVGKRHWVRYLYVPQKIEVNGTELPESETKQIGLMFKRTGNRDTAIVFSGTYFELAPEEIFFIRYVCGRWIRPKSAISDHEHVGYRRHTYTARIPLRSVRPGMRFELVHTLGGRVIAAGSTPVREVNVTVGEQQVPTDVSTMVVQWPYELFITGIDMGLLPKAKPRRQFTLTVDKSLVQQYFERIPVSRYTAVEYETVHFLEVMLPDGQLLNDTDPTEGGWFSGALREQCVKSVISTGINSANYGERAMDGSSMRQNIHAGQLMAHNARGSHSNGVQPYGLSGGGGVVTLYDSTGNEVSHEVGHNYGLAHFPKGFHGSVHRGPAGPNSAWAWDPVRNRLRPNYFPYFSNWSASAGKDSPLEPPFYAKPDKIFAYGRDAMAGGSAFQADGNRYTMYTTYVMHYIQTQFMHKKVVFSRNSPTGYLKFNPRSGHMEPYLMEMDPKYMHRFDTHGFIPPDLLKSKVLETSCVRIEYRRFSQLSYVNTTLPTLAQLVQGVRDGPNGANLAKYSDAEIAFSLHGRVITFDIQSRFMWHVLIFQNGTIRNMTSNGLKHERIFIPLRLEVSRTPAGFMNTYVDDLPGLTHVWAIAERWRAFQHTPMKQCGVPVACLIGLYDPDGRGSTVPGNNGFSFTPLYTGYGMLYDSDPYPDRAGCTLEVDFAAADFTDPKYTLTNYSNVPVAETRYYNLPTYRYNGPNGLKLNKYHINVPQSPRPLGSRIVCRGSLLYKLDFIPPRRATVYHVAGKPLDEEDL